MFCPNCGRPVPDNASFCGKCGNKLNEESTPVGGAAYNPNPNPNPAPTPAPAPAPQEGGGKGIYKGLLGHICTSFRVINL